MSTLAQFRVRFLAVALVLAVGTSVALAGRASSSRPSGGSEGRSGSATATRGGGGSSGGSTVHASGHATWRYGGSGHGGGYYPGWGGGWGWGYPYWGWSGGWYGAYAPAWYGPPGATLIFAGDPGRLPGVVETRVKPNSARVILDGQDVGRSKDYNGSWDNLKVPAGRHTLEFARDGYQTLRVDLDVGGGQSYRIDRKLQKGEGPDPGSVVLANPPPVNNSRPPIEVASDRGTSVAYAEPPPPSPSLPRGLLKIEVEPADAAVYLDGEYLARADELARLHGALPVAAGSHRVDVVRPGHAARTVEVDVLEGELGRVEIQLQPH